MSGRIKSEDVVMLLLLFAAVACLIGAGVAGDHHLKETESALNTAGGILGFILVLLVLA
jgi:hypothetical protein